MKKITPIIIVAVIVGLICFYVGVQYGKNTTNTKAQFNGQNFIPRGNNRVGQRGQGGGFMNGDIISKDTSTITLKLGDGGSKIVFISTSTSVMKSTEGSLNDLSIGENVLVMGTTNSDGSITAKSIQLRNPLSTSR